MTTEQNLRSRDWTNFAVFAGLVVNATMAFAIQAFMTYGFGRDVWGIPQPLCVALILALDFFAIMFMILSYLLRSTGWPRAVVTLIFIGAIAAQVFAAEQYGSHEAWTTPVRYFSVIPAVFLAASQEGVILWRTHRADKAASPVKAEPVAKPPRQVAEKPAPAPAPVTDATAVRPAPQRKALPRPAAGPSPVRDEAATRVISGERAADVARELGKSRRTVELWRQDYLARHPELETPALNGAKPQLTEEVTINGQS